MSFILYSPNINGQIPKTSLYLHGSFKGFCMFFLNHSILLQKLKYYGLQDPAVKLIRDYLSNRFQYVDLDGVTSNCSSVSVGIP